METVSTWSTEPPQPHCFEFQVCNFGQVTSPNPFTYLPPVRIHTYLLWELNEIMHQGWDMKHCKCPQFNCCLPSQLACAGDWIICSPVCPAAELPLLEPSPESCPSAVLGTCRLTDSHFYCEQKKKKQKNILTGFCDFAMRIPYCGCCPHKHVYPYRSMTFCIHLFRRNTCV